MDETYKYYLLKVGISVKEYETYYVKVNFATLFVNSKKTTQGA
jgi:hypothetical protein